MPGLSVLLLLVYIRDLGCRGLGFRVNICDLGFRGLGFRVYIWDLGFRGLGVYGLGV